MKTTTLLLALAAGTLPTATSAQQGLSPRDSARHALNRLTWGPTPGLVDSIARTGVMAWIESQLAVSSIDDPGLREREAAFPALQRSAEELVRGFTSLQRQARTARRDSMAGGPRRDPALRATRREYLMIGAGLQQATLIRAAESNHQLAEVMADFWFNHFNVFQNKGLVRVLLPSYVEETIRPHVLGRFEDLLLTTARSPAMLVYLDNGQSVAPGSVPPDLERLRRLQPSPRRRPGAGGGRPGMDSLMRAVAQRMPTGLNENYARELLELHTLGVDGGYTQRDVTEVARVLTGWGIRRPAQGAGFEFHAWAHDRGAKSILGEEFPANGSEDEGDRLLRLLAAHPSTMHYVSGKLCARLVSDVPTDGCIDIAVAAWKRTGGDLHEILRAVIRSPDFWAPAILDSKVRTPLEFVLSAVRAVGGVPDSTPRLAQQIARLGQPLFLQSAPTGYPETQQDWVNSGALLGRMNFAMALAAGRAPGVAVDLDRLIPQTTDTDRLIEAVNQVILSGRMSPATRQVISQELSALSDPAQARALAVGLALGGPEFQRQ